MANEEYFRDRNKQLAGMVDGNANARQVGGGHYRDKNPEFQHWDLMAVNHAGYFEGQITKYIARWREKNGVQDLEKAGHYLQKLMELVSEEKMVCPGRHTFELYRYCFTHDLSPDERMIFQLVLGFGSLEDLQRAADLLEQLKSQATK